MSKITEYRIVVPSTPETNELRAASFIRENVKLVCGKKLDIVKDSEAPTPLEIVVGKTTREAADGIELARSRDGVWEFTVFKKGERLYLTGLGTPPDTPPAYNSAYKKLDDGAIGTVMAAYRFVEEILGYQFVYATYDAFPEDPDLEMPTTYQYTYTREQLRLQRPQPIAGAALYSLNCSEWIDWNIGSFILKTREGKLIVIDGGEREELPRLIECLKSISGEAVPTVTAWLFSHLHSDHVHAYQRLCEEEWRDKLKVKDVYCNFLTREFWETLSPEAHERHAKGYDIMMTSDQALHTNLHVVQKGDKITVDEIEFEVIHVPDLAFADRMNINDSSVVYKMTYDSAQTIMFLGDAEWVCDNDLVENCAEKLPSDVVQVGHHGCGNVSRRCYELIGAQAYIWQCGERFWYQDSGEGLNTHNVGYIRYRAFMKEIGVKNENIHVTLRDIQSFPLPFPIQ